MSASSTDPRGRLQSVGAAARERGIYPPRLWRAIRDGELPAYKIGHWLRVRPEDVDQWLEARRYTPPNRDENAIPPTAEVNHGK